MKKLIIVSLVMLLLAVSVVPAFAAGGPPAERGKANGNGNQAGFGVQAPYALSGVISSLDTTNRTVTVTVACGNRLVKTYVGQDVTLLTAANTRFLLRNPDGTATPIAFEDLEVGQNISSHGTFTDGLWAATRVTVGATLSCLP